MRLGLRTGLRERASTGIRSLPERDRQHAVRKLRFLDGTAHWLALSFQNIGGLTFTSPLKLLTAPTVDLAVDLLQDRPWALLLLSLAVMFASLRFLVKVLKGLVLARVEMAFAMSQQAREISIGGMMDRDSTLSYSEAEAKLLRRLLGSELYEAAFSRTLA